ncbi:DNA methyltransferase [Salinibacterium sp. UTAS2018]|uniref:DNA methyltransferase n=1 Tax=Salinibacterium sp. UTAS2018 TaxID=2508880 RepID=UPI00143DD8A2|nr:DNA methyltransferase [Salinibacterium sp. UTAS2018]
MSKSTDSVAISGEGGLDALEASAEKLNESIDSQVRKQEKILSVLDSSFNVFEDSSAADLVHSSPNSGERFQRWFRYREGFSPELIDRAVRQLDIETVSILDPFSGAGSTLVAAHQAGIPSIGFEVNPIVSIVARAKTHNYSTADIESIRRVLRQVQMAAPGQPMAKRPALGILDKVFRTDVLNALLTIRQIIDEVPAGNVNDFLMTGWLSTLEGVSNVFKEGNGIKYRNRKRTSNGYTTIPWEQVPGFEIEGWGLVKSRLASQFHAMLEDVEPDVQLASPVVHEVSSVTGIDGVKDQSISLAIFSPPYCNNFNYMKIFKVELWMSGLVETYADVRAIGERALRSHVEMPIVVPEARTLPSELYALVEQIDPTKLWNSKIPKTIFAYFLDMRELLAGVYRTLSDGGECHIVIGNSAYGGVVIPTDVLLAKIAVELGFGVDRVAVARHLTTSSQQRRAMEPLVGYLRESIVVLKKERNA